MSGLRKQAEAIGSGTADPATAPARQQQVPQISVENKPPPGLRGPRGMSGRTTYSRVNTGIAPSPDAALVEQKNLPPRGMEFLPKLAFSENAHMSNISEMARPNLQDLIKQAMEGSASKISVSLEAARQIANVGGTPPVQEKTAAADPTVEHVPTDFILKLAAAAKYTANELNPKLAADTLEATGIGPGEGPGALEVTPAKAEGDGVIEAGQTGHAKSQDLPPQTPPIVKDPTRPTQPATSLQTNDSMMHSEQPVEPISNEKTSISSANPAYINNLLALGLLKTAATDQGIQIVPVNDVVKEAIAPLLLAAPAALAGAGALGGGALGAMQATPGNKMQGIARGAVGTAGGGALGSLGGGALGTLGGAALGGLAGGIVGGPAGALLGAGTAGLGGGLLGAGVGGLYGAGKGYSAAMRPAVQPKTASVEDIANKMVESTKKAEASQPRTQEQLVQAFNEKLAEANKSGDQNALSKLAYAKNLLILGLTKQAEDAIFPAQISSGKSSDNGTNSPEGVSPSEEGVPKEPSDVTNQKRQMLSSNQAAIDYTKREAKADPKSDVNQVLNEPALSSSTDKTLDQALSHVDEAGAKISSANLTRIAASRAVLAKLAAAQSDKSQEKKTKKAMGMGTPPTTPQAASGFNAASST